MASIKRQVKFVFTLTVEIEEGLTEAATIMAARSLIAAPYLQDSVNKQARTLKHTETCWVSPSYQQKQGLPSTLQSEWRAPTQEG